MPSSGRSSMIETDPSSATVFRVSTAKGSGGVVELEVYVGLSMLRKRVGRAPEGEYLQRVERSLSVATSNNLEIWLLEEWRRI